MKNMIEKTTVDKIYLSADWKNMIRWMDAEIGVEDKRCSTMPTSSMGKVIGVRLNAVELRIGNKMTNWYPFSHSKVKFFYPQQASGHFKSHL